MELPDDYHELGYYSPPEARRLLEALRAAGVETLAEVWDVRGAVSAADAYAGTFGFGSQIAIAVKDESMAEAGGIHSRIFGTGAGAPPEMWGGDAEHVSLLENRRELVDALDDCRTAMRGLHHEVAEVKRELDEARLHPERRAALEAAQNRNAETARSHLEKEVTLLEQIAEINAQLEGWG